MERRVKHGQLGRSFEGSSTSNSGFVLTPSVCSLGAHRLGTCGKTLSAHQMGCMRFAQQGRVGLIGTSALGERSGANCRQLGVMPMEAVARPTEKRSTSAACGWSLVAACSIKAGFEDLIEHVAEPMRLLAVDALTRLWRPDAQGLGVAILGDRKPMLDEDCRASEPRCPCSRSCSCADALARACTCTRT